MPTFFCPFTKGDCNTNCIFYNNKKTNKEQCELFQAAHTVNMYVYNIDSVDSGISNVTEKIDILNQTLENLKK